MSNRTLVVLCAYQCLVLYGQHAGIDRGFFYFYMLVRPEGWGISTLLALRVYGRSKHDRNDDEVKVETASGMRNRPVTFRGGRKELNIATKEMFNDILSTDGDIYLQILDQIWGDHVYVDLQDQDIPARSMI